MPGGDPRDLLARGIHVMEPLVHPGTGLSAHLLHHRDGLLAGKPEDLPAVVVDAVVAEQPVQGVQQHVRISRTTQHDLALGRVDPQAAVRVVRCGFEQADHAAGGERLPGHPYQVGWHVVRSCRGTGLRDVAVRQDQDE